MGDIAKKVAELVDLKNLGASSVSGSAAGRRVAVPSNRLARLMTPRESPAKLGARSCGRPAR